MHWQTESVSRRETPKLGPLLVRSLALSLFLSFSLSLFLSFFFFFFFFLELDLLFPRQLVSWV
jgi:hypothetical protein